MTCLLSSQGLVLATAMVVSSTLLFLTFSKQITIPQVLSKNHNSDPPTRNLRPCLCSEEKMREGDDKKREKKKQKKKKKKKVQFAENVKDTKGNGEEYRREKEIAMMGNKQEIKEKNKNVPREGGLIGIPCRVEIQGGGGVRGMPANRIALYNGILRDRVHRLECSH